MSTISLTVTGIQRNLVLEVIESLNTTLNGAPLYVESNEEGSRVTYTLTCNGLEENEFRSLFQEATREVNERLNQIYSLMNTELLECQTR